MPNNWKTYKLEQVATLQRGFDLPNTKRTDGKYPVIAAAGFSTWHNEFKVKGPGVVTGRSGTLGQVNFVLNDFWPLNTSLWVKDFHGNDERFIYYFLKTLNFEEYNSGTSVPTLNRNDVHKLEVTIPDLLEQQSIASILSTIDEKIENNLAINKTLEEMAMALYKHWFVDFGPFQDEEFVESELGFIPKGWEVKNFFDLFSLLSGGTPKTSVPEYWNGNINWVSAKDIGSNNSSFYINDTEKKVTDLGIKKSAAKILLEDTIIVVARGSVGKYGMLTKAMAINQSCYGIYSKSNYSQPVTYLLIQSLMNHFIQVSYGSVFDTITTSTFQNINILLPPESILNGIKNNIDEYFTQIKQNVIENQTLIKLRDTLLPKLISGEIRLKEFKKEVSTIL
jgi:type I restriction enzyme, S subunit